MCAEMLKEHLKANCMGRKNTVSGASLERTLHLSGNELRRYVNRLRRQGVPIASSRDGKWGPTRAQRSGSRGERSRNGMSEPCRCPLRRGEGYGACGDDIRQLKQMSSGLDTAIHGLEQALEQFGGGDAS